MTDPTDEQIDAMLSRTHALAIAALADHPQRARALEILEQGGHLFCKRDGEQFEYMVGWFADPTMRPPDVDPHETIVVMRLPRRVVLDAPDAGKN